MENEKKEKIKELIEKYDIDLEKLKNEQIKLAKELRIKDFKNFDEITKIGAIENAFFENKIISGIVVIDGEEVIEQQYYSDKLKFPYLSGFRAYRELPAMIEAFNKLDEKPELILVHGHGIAHERLGLASHFGLSVGIPAIGVAENLIFGEVKGEDILIKNKKVGKVLQVKEGAKPLYISPGNLISLESAEKIVKQLIQSGHKLPEPMRKAKKYVDSVREELFESA